MVYGIAALIQDVISIIGMLIAKISVSVYDFTLTLDNITTIVFIQIEFYTFCRFLYYQFEDKPLARIINNISNVIIIIFATASVIVILASTAILSNFISYLSVISSLLILTPSFYYFYVLFTDPPIKNLLTEPSFWITTGIAFLHSLNIPIFLINGYLELHLGAFWINIYIINYVAYCFMFILFIIAILCQNSRKTNLPDPTPTLTTQKHYNIFD
jgi:hypothetical protein